MVAIQLKPIMINSIVNFSLFLLYIISTKTNGTILPILLVLRESISEEMFTVDEDIARMSGEYVAITVILDRSEKFYISPWMQYSNILLLSSRIGLTIQQTDIRQSILTWQTYKICILSLGRGLLGRNIRAKYLPVCDVKLIEFWHAQHYFIPARENTTRQT